VAAGSFRTYPSRPSNARDGHTADGPNGCSPARPPSVYGTAWGRYSHGTATVVRNRPGREVRARRATLVRWDRRLNLPLQTVARALHIGGTRGYVNMTKWVPTLDPDMAVLPKYWYIDTRHYYEHQSINIAIGLCVMLLPISPAHSGSGY